MKKHLPDDVIKELIWAAHIALDWTKDTRIRIRIAEALDKAEGKV